MKQLLLLFVLVAATTLHAQEKLSYHTPKGDIDFDVSKDHYYVKLSKEGRLAMQTSKVELTFVSDSMAVLSVKDKLQPDFESRRSALKADFANHLERIEPVLIYKDGTKQVCKGELTIKLGGSCSLKDILKGYRYNAKPDEFTKKQYLVKFEDITTQELFDLVSKISNLGCADFVEPNFTRFIKPYTSDPYFNSQWSISNNGYLGGVVDADMDVDEAWPYATGQGVKVAIIDEGVDLMHPDLRQNLLGGYDATGNNSGGAPINNDAHGTACAGIVAAVANNGIGGTGIAYNSKIIPVRIAYKLPNGYWQTSDSWIVSGINWAVQNGADILSNSWGGGSPSVAIENAINNAVVNGRNGKGCVVLVASGNNNASVSFPATLLGVIAVGATSMCDERKTFTTCDGESWWGSNYGNEIDVVAPGVKIFSTDISGSKGYNTGDYKIDFNGTSSACPNVAGVAALVLSINPNFTQSQVREILETNTDKIGNYVYNSSPEKYNSTQTWNEEVGYGRINAYKAINIALLKNLTISGPDLLCSGILANYSISNLPQGATVTWYANGLNLSTATGTSTNATTKQGAGAGYVRATITSSNSTLTLKKEVALNGYTPIIGPDFEYLSNRKAYFEIDTQEPSVWSVNGNKITSTLYPNRIVIPLYQYYPGSVLVTCAVNSSCGRYEARKDFQIIGDEEALDVYSIYPNPASTTFSIKQNEQLQTMSGMLAGETKSQDNFSILIYNDQSQLVRQQKVYLNQAVSIDNLREGFYIIHIKDGKKVHKKKLIISKN